MDSIEATEIVYSRIQALDPENAFKITGYVLIQEHGEKEMIRLAFGPDAPLHSLILKAKTHLGIVIPPSHPPPPSRPCLYFSRGFCKNGITCKFSHGGYGFSAAVLAGAGVRNERCMDSARCDAQRRGGSVEGEEVHSEQRNGIYNSVASSRQIYLTFPADSTFREEDISNYFSVYGPVQDVRIPYQQKRMFGFVTFVYPETASLILAKGNPHYVCDSRVLVKPYREKGRNPTTTAGTNIPVSAIDGLLQTQQHHSNTDGEDDTSQFDQKDKILGDEEYLFMENLNLSDRYLQLYSNQSCPLLENAGGSSPRRHGVSRAR